MKFIAPALLLLTSIAVGGAVPIESQADGKRIASANLRPSHLYSIPFGIDSHEKPRAKQATTPKKSAPTVKEGIKTQPLIIVLPHVSLDPSQFEVSH
ncbi:hypothetical protein OC846_005967 [Tilletia horrida]|uniref:Uncharacterized protein n=1 Tax=Tilletia horrida TaxID=155126 RepID=A0AAN6GJR3_9BASI|nr:hypothetical protein OC846_005967 [Tilletia horrida]